VHKFSTPQYPRYWHSLHVLRAFGRDGTHGLIAPIRYGDCRQHDKGGHFGISFHLAADASDVGGRQPIYVPTILAELAVLDLRARALDVPAHGMLGVPIARSFDLCVSLVGLQASNLASRIHDLLARSLAMPPFLKISLIPYRASPNPIDIPEAVANVRRVLEVAPAATSVIADCHGRATLDLLDALAGLHEPRLIVEDPFPWDDHNHYAQLPSGLRLAIGEQFTDSAQFIDGIATREISVIWQPEIANLGSIRTFLQVVEYARKRRKIVMPHGRMLRALLHILQLATPAVPIYPEFHIGREDYMQAFGFAALSVESWSCRPGIRSGLGLYSAEESK